MAGSKVTSCLLVRFREGGAHAADLERFALNRLDSGPSVPRQCAALHELLAPRLHSKAAEGAYVSQLDPATNADHRRCCAVGCGGTDRLDPPRRRSTSCRQVHSKQLPAAAFWQSRTREPRSERACRVRAITVWYGYAAPHAYRAYSAPAPEPAPVYA